MQDTWSHLLLIFGFAASLVTASMNSSAPTTMVTRMSANPYVTSANPHAIVSPESANPNVTVTVTSANRYVTSAKPNVTVSLESTNSNSTVTTMSANPNFISANSHAAVSPKSAKSNNTVTRMSAYPNVTSANSHVTVSPESATSNITESPVEISVHPTPTTSPNLSTIYDSQPTMPIAGSFGILNGIPTRLLNDSIKENTPIHAEAPKADYNHFYQPWNTSYPGPIHDDDWAKYLQIWDPVWWSTNLDSLRQISCICSAEDFYTNPQAQLAAYMNFEYYSQRLGNTYTFDWVCGPAPSAMDISYRRTSGKGLSEHCWAMAGGDDDDHRSLPMTDWFCDPKDDFCVKPWRDGHRELKFQGHQRHYDRHGVHTWSELHDVVADVCEPICSDKFRMKFDDFSHHNPSFVTTFYPPKPIDLTVVGD